MCCFCQAQEKAETSPQSVTVAQTGGRLLLKLQQHQRKTAPPQSNTRGQHLEKQGVSKKDRQNELRVFLDLPRRKTSTQTFLVLSIILPMHLFTSFVHGSLKKKYSFA